MSQNISDRIWITAHVRMRTESRLRRSGLFLNLLTLWYSTALTCLTVYQLVAIKDQGRDLISASLAIIILSLSIFVPSLGLDRQADKFRECYLNLQRLLDQGLSDAAKTVAYHDLLEAYPNHPSRDYTDFVVNSYLNGQSLESGGKAIVPTCMMHVEYWLCKVRDIIVAFTGFASPVLLYFVL